MTDLESPRTPAASFVFSPEALFRYQVVSQVVAGVRAGKPLARVVEEVAARLHLSWAGGYQLRKVSVRSTYRWHAAFEVGGAAALEPADRACTQTSVVLSEKLIDFLRAEKADDDEASVPELIRRARLQGMLRPDDPIDRTTVWRALKRMGLPRSRRSSKRNADMRRFAYPHRMMMVLSDGKQFRAGPSDTRRLVLFFIDDASRYVPIAVVGATESTEVFLRGLYELIRRVGLMDILFLDNGGAFISDDTTAVCVRLGICLIHGTAAYPEGHGKIERFHLTAWQDLLRALAAPGICDAYAALELRINHYLAQQYNLQQHEGIDKETPLARWQRDERALRFHPDDATLRECFVVTETRSVSSDNVVSVAGTHYEVPRGHRNTTLQILRQTLDGTLRIFHDGKLVRIHPVDLETNAIARRARPETTHVEVSSPPRTAALIAFDRDFGSVVAPNGGYLPPTNDKE